MVSPSAKKRLMAVLVVAFGIQTALVYSDERAEPLSETELSGRTLWHQNGCQSCHQLYGQGGFLGPDLTNARSRVDDTRLRSLLTAGSGQMPAFGFTDTEVAEMAAFLAAVDRPEIGRGQVRLGAVSDGAGPVAAFEEVVASALDGAPAPVRSGFEAYRARSCSACHLPFQASSAGPPDLSLAVTSLSDGELRRVLAQGRLERGMPPPTPALSEAEIEAVVAYFGWLNRERETLVGDLRNRMAQREVDWAALPWWEYR